MVGVIIYTVTVVAGSMFRRLVSPSPQSHTDVEQTKTCAHPQPPPRLGMSRAGDTNTRSDIDDELVKAREPLSVDDRRQRLVSIFDRDRHFSADGVAQPVASDGTTGPSSGSSGERRGGSR